MQRVRLRIVGQDLKAKYPAPLHQPHGCLDTVSTYKDAFDSFLAIRGQCGCAEAVGSYYFCHGHVLRGLGEARGLERVMGHAF